MIKGEVPWSGLRERVELAHPSGPTRRGRAAAWERPAGAGGDRRRALRSAGTRGSLLVHRVLARDCDGRPDGPLRHAARDAAALLDVEYGGTVDPWDD